MKNLFLAFALIATTVGRTQGTDTIKVMSYNLLNFPLVNSSRIADLEIIVQEALPDIFMACEVTSNSGATGILDNALNQNGISYYAKANFVSGPDTDNMLYYNSNKLGLLEQNEISTALRDINEYVLYYKSQDIATTSDTTYFYCYVAHLKASQGYETERNLEAQEAKDFMATRSGLENVLFGGDFNLYGSSEPAWNTILNGAGVTLVDPINLPGEWHIDWGYQDYHTQSTRTTNLDGGASGGMDDRFDFIFMSPDLNNWGNQAKYIPGTYWAYGQDGNHFDDDINAAPANVSLPANVIQALYDMSDHLPVYMEIEVQKSYNSIVETDFGIHAFYNSAEQKLQFSLKDLGIQLGEISIFNLSGQEVMKINQLENDLTIDVSLLEQGMYIVREANYGFSMKFVR